MPGGETVIIVPENEATFGTVAWHYDSQMPGGETVIIVPENEATFGTVAWHYDSQVPGGGNCHHSPIRTQWLSKLCSNLRI